MNIKRKAKNPIGQQSMTNLESGYQIRSARVEELHYYLTLKILPLFCFWIRLILF